MATEEKTVLFNFKQDMATKGKRFRSGAGYWGKRDFGQQLATQEASSLVRIWLLKKKVFWSVAWLLRKIRLWSLAGYRLLRKIVLASSWLLRKKVFWLESGKHGFWSVAGYWRKLHVGQSLATEDKMILVSSWLFRQTDFGQGLATEEWFWSGAGYWKSMDVVSNWLLKKYGLSCVAVYWGNGFWSVAGHWGKI